MAGAAAASAAVALTIAIIEADQRMAMTELQYPRYRPLLPPPLLESMIDQFTETECLEFFRFTRSEMQQILPYLELD